MRLPGVTFAEAIFAFAQIGRALCGEPLLWGNWTWSE